MDVFVRACCFKRVSDHAFEDDDVLGGVDLVVEVIEEALEVLRISIRVDDHHRFQEHHLAGSHEADGRLSPLPGIPLL